MAQRLMPKSDLSKIVPKKSDFVKEVKEPPVSVPKNQLNLFV